MAMSDNDAFLCARQLAKHIFRNKTANFNITELKAAVKAIYDGLDSQISEHSGSDTVEVALNKLLPQPFKADATIEEKGYAFAYAVMKKYGII